MSRDRTYPRKDLTNLSREELLQVFKHPDKHQLLDALQQDHYKKYGKRPR